MALVQEAPIQAAKKPATVVSVYPPRRLRGLERAKTRLWNAILPPHFRLHYDSGGGYEPPPVYRSTVPDPNPVFQDDSGVR